jgi:hypothetical protein
MKENDRIDQWLRERMDDYKPAPSDLSKHRFLSSIPTNEVSKIHKGWIYGLSTFIVLITLVFFAVSISDRHIEAPIKNDSKSEMKVNNQGLNSEDDIIEVAKDQLSTKTITAETNPNISAQENNDHTVESINKNHDHTIKAANKSNDLIIEPAHKNKDLSIEPAHKNYDLTIESAHKNYDLNIEPEYNDNTETKVSDTKIQDGHADVTLITENKEFAWENSLTDTIVFPVNDESSGAFNEKDDGVDKPYRGSRNKYIGLYYKPGLMWNIIENEKLTHSFGVEWQSRFFSGNYILGTGIGMLRTTGYYEYAVNYNEFLGTYQRLDSISFLWNPREFSMQQTYYTTEETVHDTAIKTGYHKLYRDFVYLQIPIVMGYDIVRKEKYSIGIRFSPILSVLMSKKPVDFQYEAGLDKVIQINRITPDRVRTNWQLNTGLNFSRRISKNIQLEIEPGFTYYFNSVYEKAKVSSRPYGASVRMAIGIIY